MNVAFYATRIQAQVMSQHRHIEDAYERFSDAVMFWCMIDLVDSSNFRLVYGPKEGYVRAETFFSLIRAVINPSSEIRLLKEIGDAVLLAAPTFRPLFESVVLIDKVAKQLDFIANTEYYPFAVRCGIAFGPSKRLMGRNEDFVSSSLDQLARIMGIRSSKSNFFVHEDAFKQFEPMAREYGAFLRFSGPSMLPVEKARNMLKEIYYREMDIDQKALGAFKECFVPWRNQKVK